LKGLKGLGKVRRMCGCEKNVEGGMWQGGKWKGGKVEGGWKGVLRELGDKSEGLGVRE